MTAPKTISNTTGYRDKINRTEKIYEIQKKKK